MTSVLDPPSLVAGAGQEEAEHEGPVVWGPVSRCPGHVPRFRQAQAEGPSGCVPGAHSCEGGGGVRLSRDLLLLPLSPAALRPCGVLELALPSRDTRDFSSGSFLTSLAVERERHVGIQCRCSVLTGRASRGGVAGAGELAGG